MNGANRKVVLIGHSGFLGAALRSALATRCDSDVELVGRDFVRSVMEGDGHEVVPALLARDVPQDWICAIGIVDPHGDPGLIEAINVEFPRRLHGLLGSLAPAQSARFVTIGSVLEGREGLASSNAYLASKFQMFESLRDRPGELPWHHIRLHTLYGGNNKPHAFMFAGQMFDALANKKQFKMSDGTQLREYHHVQDIAESIMSFLAASPREQTVELNSGEPIRLRDLSSAVFEHFGKSDLLEIGARLSSQGEVFESAYRRSPYLVASRDSIQGVIDWFNKLLGVGS